MEGVGYSRRTISRILAAVMPQIKLDMHHICCIMITNERQAIEKAIGRIWLGSGQNFRQPPYHDKR